MRIIRFSGIMASSREIALVEFEMPRAIESREQGIAWVTWALDQHATGGFQPVLPADWLETGRSYRELLPWEQEFAAYKARPHCHVDRDWARMALRKLKEALDAADADADVTFHFDGQILRIWCGDTLVPVPASGTEWQSQFALSAGRLRHLPKRLTRVSAEFGIWEERLTIGTRSYPGVRELS